MEKNILGIDSNSSKMVGLVLPKNTIENLDSFLTETIKYLSLALECRGYNMALFNEENYDLERFENLYDNKLIGGIIMFSPSLNDAERAAILGKSRIPSAVLFSHYDKIDSFTCDNEHGGYMATMFLLEKGRRRIAFIHGSPTWTDSYDRFLGYKKALAESGAEFRPELVKNAYYDYYTAKVVVQEFMAQGNKPDAIFAANDKMAMGAIQGIRQKGLEVPKDVSVVGYDDVKENEYAELPLTTLVQPIKDICDNLAERMASKIEGKIKNEKPVLVALKPKLIVRESA
ncbi:MAG: substrate-binding domain-containing protein [Elusimicrobiota bacterium]